MFQDTCFMVKKGENIYMGRVKKTRNFPLSSGPQSPTPLNEKMKKIKNELHTMKQMMYDMGHLTVARWLL